MNDHTQKPTLNRCLVLGGNGFIGSHLVDRLANDGHMVRIFDRMHSEKDSEHNAINENQIEYYTGDFTNEYDLKLALKGIDCVFHLISTTTPKYSNDDPVYDIETNLVGTVRLLDIVRKITGIKLIFVSSGGTVYGVPNVIPISEDHSTNPICSYGVSKLAIEKYLYLYNYLYGLDYVVLRVSNPYGEKQNPNSAQGAIPVFMLKYLQNKAIHIWGDGSIARDFIYIDDVINALIAAMSVNDVNKVFNIGSGVPTNLNELVEYIENVSGQARPAIVEYMPERKVDVPVNCLDISRAASHLGWSPKISMQDGLAKTLEWLQKNHKK